jgi:flagellar hook-length control protein FliK
MQQVSAALVRLAIDAPGRIELTLTPETLGRVHFDMRPEGAGLAITVSAERSETLDLIRRHLPDLLAELREAGVQAGTLSFGSWGEGQSAPSKEGWTKGQDHGPARTPLDSPAPAHQPTTAVTGLNLRL